MMFRSMRRLRAATIVKVFGAAALILCALLWRYTPFASFSDPSRIQDLLASCSQQPQALLVVIAAFVAGAMMLVPMTILIAATAAVFGPWVGLAYATAGVLASALIGYALGAGLGKESLSDLLGPRLDRVRQRMACRGMIAVAASRIVPIAPFTVINVVVGASGIRLRDYLAGTSIGIAPALLVMSTLGSGVSRVLAHPTAFDYALLAAAAMAWLILAVALPVLFAKARSGREG